MERIVTDKNGLNLVNFGKISGKPLQTLEQTSDKIVSEDQLFCDKCKF